MERYLKMLTARAATSRIVIEEIPDSESIRGTNVIAFGLWYWGLDRGGPVRRLRLGLTRFR